MRALRPDVGIVHAQRPTAQGNVQLWGISGVQKEAVLASAAVARDGRGDRGRARAACPGAIILPGWVVTAVAVAPGGAHPSYVHGYYERDNAFYVRWDGISRDRERASPTGSASTCCEAARMSDTRADEMMAVAAARRLRDGAVCFVGIGLPSQAANLARATHAPGCVLIYESGTIGAKPLNLPLSIGDGELAETADAVVGVPEIFATGCRPGGSTSASSAPPRSTATAT